MMGLHHSVSSKTHQDRAGTHPVRIPNELGSLGPRWHHWWKQGRWIKEIVVYKRIMHLVLDIKVGGIPFTSTDSVCS